MRLLFVLLGGLLVSVGVGACGGTRTSTGVPAVAGASPARATGPYLNDGDHDRIGDEDGDNNGDTDNDAPWDYKHERNDNGDYHDRDDGATLSLGHAADAATRRAITALVKRYYAAAAVEDGRRACSMLPPELAKAVPLDWGGSNGPEYLRGQKTCQAVMVLLFKHSHDQLSAPVTVTGVQLNGNSAYAFVGSATMPAGYLIVQRQHGAWAIVALLGNVLS
jgi:hypothetical protein